MLLGLIGGLQFLGPVGPFIGPAIVSMSVAKAKDRVVIGNESSDAQLWRVRVDPSFQPAATAACGRLCTKP